MFPRNTSFLVLPWKDSEKNGKIWMKREDTLIVLKVQVDELVKCTININRTSFLLTNLGSLELFRLIIFQTIYDEHTLLHKQKINFI